MVWSSQQGDEQTLTGTANEFLDSFSMPAPGHPSAGQASPDSPSLADETRMVVTTCCFLSQTENI